MRDWFGRPFILVQKLLDILGADRLDAVMKYVDLPSGFMLSNDTRIFSDFVLLADGLQLELSCGSRCNAFSGRCNRP